MKITLRKDAEEIDIVGSRIVVENNVAMVFANDGRQTANITLALGVNIGVNSPVIEKDNVLDAILVERVNGNEETHSLNVNGIVIGYNRGRIFTVLGENSLRCDGFGIDLVGKELVRLEISRHH